MVADSGLFNPEVYGDSSRWQGQIADDSGWRDNISPGKIESPESTKGWGRRYKVRIMGIHDKEEESISSDQLPWAQVEMPITAGGGQAGASATPNLRQGMFVYGYFQDGPEQQVPIITGVLGHNATTELKQKIGDTDSNFAPTSGYAEGKVPKTFRTKEVVPKYDQVTAKPKTASAQNDVETADSVGSGTLDQFGLKKNLDATAEQLKDIATAQNQADLIGLVGEAKEIFVKSRVHQEIRNRVRRANSPITPPVPGATCESADAPHRLNAGQVQREDKYREKVVVAKPDDPVESSMKAMQTIIDTLANKIDKYQKSLQNGGYIDMVSMKNPMRDLERDIDNSSQEMSKYMKVLTDKMMEFVNKTTNKELNSAVSAMPSSMRFMFADMKELTGQTTHKMYLDIGNNLSGTIGPILKQSLNVNNILETAKQRAINIDMDINLPLPNVANLANKAAGVLDSVNTNVSFPTKKTIGNVPPPQVISGSGTKEDPWISPATEFEVGDSFTGAAEQFSVASMIAPQGDIAMPAQEVLPPPPPPQNIPPLPEWIAQYGPEEGKIKYKEAKRGLITSVDSGLTPPPTIGQAYTPVTRPPTVEEFSEQIVSNSNADGIVDLSISTDVVDFESVTKPTVPMCYAEDVAAQIIHAHKKTIDEANNAILENMNAFIGDMQDMLGIEQEKPSGLLPGLEKGAIVSITDEEVLDQVRGGSNYVTEKGVGITFFKSIVPDVTSSPGSGALVDITVSSGGLSGNPTTGADHFTWVSRGTGYSNQNAVNCSGGSGSGMRVNLVTTGGEVTTMFVHTTGEGYLDGEQMTIQSGNFNATFTINKVAGTIDPSGIKIAKNGGNYQPGDVLKVNGGNFDASFTLTAVNDAPLPEKKKEKKPNPMSGLLSKLGGIQGNLSKVLSFQNVKTNVFDFEMPPNKAVSDFYHFARGGASQAESQMPSLDAVAENVNVDQLIPKADEALSFVQPSRSQPNINRLLRKADSVKDELEIG